MTELKIIGNGHERDLIYWWELSPEEQSEFDYATEESLFFRYKGQLYCLDDFTATHNPFYGNDELYKMGFDGVAGDSYFSGTLIKLDKENGEFIKVYTYYS